MAKLYFKYGTMGSAKTAEALITKFNYEERGMCVWLIKPATDKRDGENAITSRIGLSSECTPIAEGESVIQKFESQNTEFNCIIADESQFFTPEQIDELRTIVDTKDIPVMCFGLRTDFMSKLFRGSARLFELADSVSELKAMCACGSKALINARIGDDGRIVTRGHKILLGGNDKYIAMCHKCWHDRIKEEENSPLQLELNLKQQKM